MAQIIKEHNIETGEIIEREMTAKEIAQWEADNLIAAEELEMKNAKATAKAELLAKLGISEDEAKLLLA